MGQHQFALAVLLAEGRYVVQLRDDNRDIAAPGVWGLFGGRVEEGEAPSAAVLREVHEELCILLTTSEFLWSIEHDSSFEGGTATFWLFEADITEYWGRHRLTEGQAAQSFAYAELHALPMPVLIRKTLDRHYRERVLPHATVRASR